MVTNSKIQSRDISLIISRDLSKIPEYIHATFHNSASFGRDSGYLDKTPTHKQFLAAQLHAFLIQDSPYLTQLNDVKKTSQSWG